MVVIKLIFFKIDDILVKCKEKIVRFIVVFVWVKLLVRSGYRVYFVFVFINDVGKRRNEGGRS